MNPNKVRGIIAVLVVGVFMLLTCILAILPFFSHTDLVLEDYANFFAKIASSYTGIVGVIVGFYFGQSFDSREK